MDSYEKVYPSAEELSKINKNLNCPECSSVFYSESNLNLHLAKTHKKSKLLQKDNTSKAYHCPVETCTYNSSAHFKQFKSLKQHYLKVHSEKSYICSLCKKGFPTESFRNRHFEYCNVTFKCCDCDQYYSCYETLRTHSRRKNHSILDKTAYKSCADDTVLKGRRSEVALFSSKVRLLLPKPSSSMGMIIISDTSEQSSQTDTESAERNSQESQTLLTSKMPQFTVETQTIGDYFPKKQETVTSALKSIKTQTSTTDPKTVSCNTSFILDDLELSDVQRSSSSTQTSICNESKYLYSSSTSTHDSIHTDTSDLLAEIFDSNFFNCNMETQTDFMNDDLFKYCNDYSDYTNMYTQTCEDLLGEIGLNNTHTQTVFDDVLKSVESQTIMSQSKRIPLSCKDMSHMETQTDMHFQQMLEEINA